VQPLSPPTVLLSCRCCLTNCCNFATRQWLPFYVTLLQICVSPSWQRLHIRMLSRCCCLAAAATIPLIKLIDCRLLTFSLLLVANPSWHCSASPSRLIVAFIGLYHLAFHRCCLLMRRQRMLAPFCFSSQPVDYRHCSPPESPFCCYRGIAARQELLPNHCHLAATDSRLIVALLCLCTTTDAGWLLLWHL